MTKRLIYTLVLFTALILPLYPSGDVSASKSVPQTWLPGDTLFPTIGFTTNLPVFGPGYNAVLPRVDAKRFPFLTVTMKEVDQQVLPLPHAKTRVWAYETTDTRSGTILGPAHWPAVTVETQRGVPTIVTYTNNLPNFNAAAPQGPGLVQGLVTTDRTLYWADPLNSPMMNPCMNNPLGGPGCATPFVGAPPAVAHLHGGETFSGVDGGPDSWFTSTGLKGPDYYSYKPAAAGQAIYKYDNSQEGGTLWFHDHALGATRTNVYSGLAAFYFLRYKDGEPQKLPSGAYEVEMAIQDRQFDTNGQLLFPDGSGSCGTGLPDDPCLNGPPTNPTIHTFWSPEFIGDVVVVNGAPWPVFNVEPRRYLFRILDGSNARMYRLTFGNAALGEPLPPIYQIGSDDSYIDVPAALSKLFVAPGERAYVIVDFTGLAGKTVTVINDSPMPFPMGLVPGVDVKQLSMKYVMQFKVSLPLVGKDKSCDPAAGGCKRPVPIVRLADGVGGIAPGVTISKKRQLTLKEQQGPGGPVQVLVNNTQMMGLNSPNIAASFPVDGVSELPQVGSTELWEIINLTADAHPMHTHLAQFQIVNRQAYNTVSYPAAWGAAFGTGPVPLPAGCVAGVFCPGYGPPLVYGVANADGAIGGNPAVTPYLVGAPRAPDPGETGWKDTAKSYPGEVMRILVRFAPTSAAQKCATPGKSLYKFDPTQGPGYVWHCHIIDHEDNEMMRPFRVVH
jgi:spore coat protein A